MFVSIVFQEVTMKRNLLIRFSFTFLIILLALSVSGWTVNPTSVLAAPVDGTWTGTTSRGYPVSFLVLSSGTQWDTFKVKTDFNFGSCYGTLEMTVFGPDNITNNQFGFSSSTFSFTGQFSTPGTASGTYSFVNHNLPGCGLLTQSGTWTAQIPSTFVDVPFSYWSHDWIERLYNAGITGGCGTNPLVYCPTSSVTRDQMAVFLLRGIHGKTYTPPAATGTVFSDVPTSYWAASWIERLAAEGITGGCGTGIYCPNTIVTRDQMAVFLLRAEHGSGYVPPAATGTVFSDVPTSYWAASWIERLAAEGITGGCGTGVYCPTSSVTRDQMAVFLVRTF